jgi:uncharacterized protein YndB with AHSA1/START domain
MAVNESASEPVADREHVITRELSAPARIVFEAYTKPEHIKRWFGPKPWPVTSADMDFRVGGRFRFQMTGPGGELGPPFGGTYLEIVPNRKIVYDNAFEATPDEKMIVTVTFDDKGPKTPLTVHTLFGTAAMKKDFLERGYGEGTGIALDQLGAMTADSASASATMRA